MPLLLILLALFGFALTAWGTSSEPSVGAVTAETIPAARVPGVTGSYPRYAERRLRAAGLVPELRWCSTGAVQYAVGRVAPAEGTVVPRGAHVRLSLVPAHNSGIKPPPCNSFVATRPATIGPVVKCSKRMTSGPPAAQGPRCGPPPANP